MLFDAVNRSEGVVLQDLTPFLAEAIVNHSGAQKYDFSYNAHYADTFSVNGFTYNASEFGNFLAGYTGAYKLGFVGYSGVVGLGVVYDLVGHGVNSDFDSHDRSDIKDGAALGEMHSSLGVTDCGCEN